MGATSSPTLRVGGAGVSILAHLERWALRYIPEAHLDSIVFQSSPTSKGGRYHLLQIIIRKNLCFNPRPPRKVGATFSKRSIHYRPKVSILAHLERWALPRPTKVTPIVSQFQSSPTSKGGRYLSHLSNIRQEVHSRTLIVSILAHLERWALRPAESSPTSRFDPFRMFQSSPTSKGGRYSDMRPCRSDPCMFQSSPTSKGGRYLLRLRACTFWSRFNPRPPRKVGATKIFRPSDLVLLVSILAHLERWALRGRHHLIGHGLWFQSSPTSKGGRYPSRCREPTSLPCFNPRPPRKVGATTGAADGRDVLVVSILAHLERWALPYSTDSSSFNVFSILAHLQRRVSILAHLERWALRRIMRDKKATLKFQSSPTSKGGRYRHHRRLLHSVRCFNPRPPRKVGATPYVIAIIPYLMVSILAHLERWALLRFALISDVVLGFNSPTCTSRRLGFNPRPPRKVGATL